MTNQIGSDDALAARREAIIAAKPAVQAALDEIALVEKAADEQYAAALRSASAIHAATMAAIRRKHASAVRALVTAAAAPGWFSFAVGPVLDDGTRATVKLGFRLNRGPKGSHGDFYYSHPKPAEVDVDV